MTNILPVMLNPSLVVILKEQKRLKNLRTGSVKHLLFLTLMRELKDSII